MKKKNPFDRVLQNTRCPEGFWGRMMLRGMNIFHSPLAQRGLNQVEWKSGWKVLDIGCGGGANLKRLLRLCPKGEVYGIDMSQESVSFACRYNSRELDKRCFIRWGNVCSLPYGNGTFDAVTAFETVYFWVPLELALEEVARVLKTGGVFLISMEAGDPESGRKWTDRIDGMTIYPAEILKEKLEITGFSQVRTICRKDTVHIVAIRK